MSILLEDIYVPHWLQNINNANIEKNVGYIHPHYLFKIEDTIHFNALTTNDFSNYFEYITKTNQKEHSVKDFKELIDNFSLEKVNKIKLEYNNKINKYLVRDGIHRLSILLFKGYIKDLINLNLLDIIYDNDSIEEIKKYLIGTTKDNFYNGWTNRTTYGYHSINICNIQFPGQRNPLKRLNKIKDKINFNQKVVIDFGCNIGGMLLHLPEIKKGYGIDFSQSCIDCGNKIKEKLKYNNELTFITGDLNNLDFEKFLKDNNIQEVDVIFLLSLGSWVKNWENLYTKSFNTSKNIVLELNNDKEGEPQMNLFKKLGAKIELINEQSDDDILGNLGRKCYLISKN